MNRYFNHGTSFEIAGAAREIELENKLISPEYQLRQEEQTRMLKYLPLKTIHASNYLLAVEPNLINLVSPQNFKEIVSIAHLFPGNLTSFLGFECRLGNFDSQSDWAFAISGVGGDRKGTSKSYRKRKFSSTFIATIGVETNIQLCQGMG